MMINRYIAAAFLIGAFMVMPLRAFAACTSPADPEGTVLYNRDYHVMQFCNGSLWKPFPHPNVIPDACAASPAPGAVCGDGTVYAGLSTDGNVAMYTTPADGSNEFFNNGSSWCCSGTGATNGDTGAANTTTLINLTDGNSPYEGAVYCHGLTTGGHNDWYLPAVNETNVLYTNSAAIGGFNTSASYPLGYYLNSDENGGNYTQAIVTRFSDGFQLGENKGASIHSVRCIRKGSYTATTPTPTCTSAQAGTMEFNVTHRVLQYCDGTTWFAAGPINPTGPLAGCTNPSGVGGAVIYSNSYHTLQYCDGDRWAAVP